MKFYIAASWVARDVAVKRADQLRALGHEVISTWINEDTVPFPDKIIAMIDASEVMAADRVILLLDVGTKSTGKHVELGIAIASGKQVVVIGSLDDCLFYKHPVCVHFEDWESFIRSL